MSLVVDNIFVEQFYDEDLLHWYVSLNGRCIVQLPYQMTAQQIFTFVRELEKENFF